MKNVILLFALLLSLFSCQSETQKTANTSTTDVVTPEEPSHPAETRAFISISDIHLDIDSDTIYKTNHGWMDTDRKLWELTKKKLTEIVEQKDDLKIDYMVFTGDIPVHSEDNTVRAKNMGVVLSYLSELSGNSGLPLLFVPGNNDGLAGDYASFRNAKDEAPYVTDTLNANKWPFIGNKGDCSQDAKGSCYIDSSPVYGYYAAYPLPHKKLRFIGLNTVIHNNRENKTICYNPPADGERQAIAAKLQMDWFEQQMKAAHAANEKILIAMHIPPGMDGYSGQPSWANFATSSQTTINNAFIQSIAKYKDNVIGILTGHSHQDELKMILNKQNEMVGVCLTTPGITPQHGNNPGFKLFHYDNKTFELLDYTTIWSDFFTTETVEPFDKTYTFSDVYQNRTQKTIEERLDFLLTQDSLDFIENSMAKTFKVMRAYSLTANEKAAMKMSVDEQVMAIETSKCN